jgi:glycosyltransferase involved in cell wall biosynthesis
MSIYHGEEASYLDECLASIARQTLLPDQVVVVEDGPVPTAMAAVLGRWSACLPIEGLRLPMQRGLGPALNAGLSACRNDIVGRMDADDVAMEDRFARQIEHMAADPGLHVLGGQIEEFGDGGGRRLTRNVLTDPEGIRARALFRNPMNHMTVCYRRDRILGIGGYRDRPGMEDYDLWVRALAATLVLRNLPLVLVRARTGAAFYSRRRGAVYAKSEWSLCKTKMDARLWPAWRVVVVSLMRALVRVAPSAWIALLYRRLLRRAA